jgi:Zn-dependent alcohol dehydrogenase
VASEVRGVIAPGKGEPVRIETVVVPDPGPGEALVSVQACGVCHTDLHYREGGVGDDFPYLLGHEAAGTVDAVGPGVTAVAPGDFVVLNWRAVCGDCVPSRDFPVLIDLYLQGRFDLDRFVSETIALDEVEDAFHKMERREVLRSVVTI